MKSSGGCSAASAAVLAASHAGKAGKRTMSAASLIKRAYESDHGRTPGAGDDAWTSMVNVRRAKRLGAKVT